MFVRFDAAACALLLVCFSPACGGGTSGDDDVDTGVGDASEERDAGPDANADADVGADAAVCGVPSGVTSDGCCPSGVGNANNDVDCAAVCGNGVVEPTELCDTGIVTGGLGGCPTSCTPTDVCDAAAVIEDACQTRCGHTAITAEATTADLCCPAGANANTDADCAAVCGNGIREGAEHCDTTAVGDAACPATCAPRVACETGALLGTACDQRCEYTPITATSGPTADTCCPDGGTGDVDIDCAVCGNDLLEWGEVCDVPTSATATCEDCSSFTCKGERYDADHAMANGCEVADAPLNNHTAATASFYGAASCDDAPLRSLVGTIARDRRVHVPAVPGFSMATGSAPDYFEVFAAGGTCFNDPAATLTVTNGTNCFKLTVQTNLTTLSCTTSAGACSLTSSSGSYGDGTTIYFIVERTCPAVGQAAAAYTVNFHL